MSTADEVYASLIARMGEARPEPRLDPTRRALELAGSPHRAFPFVHVTGTNGKTSTARMTAGILTRHGLRTGLFTSPHLIDFTERMLVDGGPVAEAVLERTWSAVQGALRVVDDELQGRQEPRLTFFEALTVLGFAVFAASEVDVAVVEVGMGGLWDSTNVGDGRVAVLMPISMDHTEFLGGSIAAIARNKAGIVKPGARVVSAAQPAAARVEIELAVRAAGAVVLTEGVDFSVAPGPHARGGQFVSMRFADGTDYPDLFVTLAGAHQAQNAAAAVAASREMLAVLGRPLRVGPLREALATATSPGRFQTVEDDPRIIVDAAHNLSGVGALAATIDAYLGDREIALVIGILRDKDAAGMIPVLASRAATIFPTRSESDRAIPEQELHNLISGLGTGIDVMEPAALPLALAEARRWAKNGPSRVVVVTGSITLVSDVLRLTGARVAG